MDSGIEARLSLYRTAIREVQILLLQVPLPPHVLHFIYHYRYPVLTIRNIIAPVLIADDTVPRSLQNVAWYDLAVLRKPDSDYAMLLSIMDRAIQKFPDCFWLRCIRARLLWPIKYYAAAKEDLHIFLLKHPHHAYALSMLAETYYLLEKYGSALLSITNAILEDNAVARYYVSRAKIYKKLASARGKEGMKKYCEMALEDLETAQKLSPMSEITQAIGHLHVLLDEL